MFSPPFWQRIEAMASDGGSVRDRGSLCRRCQLTPAATECIPALQCAMKIAEEMRQSSYRLKITNICAILLFQKVSVIKYFPRERFSAHLHTTLEAARMLVPVDLSMKRVSGTVCHVAPVQGRR